MFTINGKAFEVQPRYRRDVVSLTIENTTVNARLHWHGDHEATLTVNGKSQPVYVAQDEQTLFIHLNGKTWQVEAKDAFGSAAEAGETSGRVTAPMPGVVMECSVAVGDSVTAGKTVMLIESMKLQTEIKAPASGTVTVMERGAGDSFEKGSVLIEIATEDSVATENGQ